MIFPEKTGFHSVRNSSKKGSRHPSAQRTEQTEPSICLTMLNGSETKKTSSRPTSASRRQVPAPPSSALNKQKLVLSSLFKNISTENDENRDRQLSVKPTSMSSAREMSKTRVEPYFAPRQVTSPPPRVKINLSMRSNRSKDSRKSPKNEEHSLRDISQISTNSCILGAGRPVHHGDVSRTEPDECEESAPEALQRKRELQEFLSNATKTRDEINRLEKRIHSTMSSCEQEFERETIKIDGFFKRLEGIIHRERDRVKGFMDELRESNLVEVREFKKRMKAIVAEILLIHSDITANMSKIISIASVESGPFHYILSQHQRKIDELSLERQEIALKLNRRESWSLQPIQFDDKMEEEFAQLIAKSLAPICQNIKKEINVQTPPGPLKFMTQPSITASYTKEFNSGQGIMTGSGEKQRKYLELLERVHHNQSEHKSFYSNLMTAKSADCSVVF
jgi:hypothetical protein